MGSPRRSGERCGAHSSADGEREIFSSMLDSKTGGRPLTPEPPPTSASPSPRQYLRILPSKPFGQRSRLPPQSYEITPPPGSVFHSHSPPTARKGHAAFVGAQPSISKITPRFHAARRRELQFNNSRQTDAKHQYMGLMTGSRDADNQIARHPH